MKTLFLTIAIVFSYLCSGQTTAIPDLNFRQALMEMNINVNNDGEVLNSEVSEITILDVSNKNISDLTGIEAFVGLTQLFCNTNNLTSLDVTANTALTLLYCYENNLENLDVSYNTALTILNCARNNLNSLNVDNNTLLTKLLCPANNIPDLNLRNNTLLTELYCDQNNLSSLNIAENTELQILNCANNPIGSLSLVNNPQLTKLFCYNNQLDALIVDNNTNLTELFCHENNLTKLNINNNTNLIKLWCQSNNLNSLEVKNSNNANIVLFNATNNPGLTCIDVDDATYSSENWLNFVDGGVEIFSNECNPDPVQVTLTPDGSLTISDNINVSSDDNYALSISGDNLILTNTIPINFSGDGIVQIDPYTVQIPLSSINTGITIDGQGGNNDLAINAPSALGETSLTVKNIRSIVRGNGSVNLKALNVTNGDFNIAEIITIITTAANFTSNGSLSGNGAINGNVNMKKDSKIKPGNSSGILNSGNLLLEFDSTFDAEINGLLPGTAHDQINVTGTVTINNAILNLIGGYQNNSADEIVLINNDGEDTVIGTFFNYPEGEKVLFGGFGGYITYSGGDGNDVSLKSNGTQPEISCPEIISSNTDPDTCSTTVNFLATETVGIPATVITYSHEPGSAFNAGTTVVTATATNAFGSSSCSFEVIVNNITPSNTEGIVAEIDPIEVGTNFELSADFNDDNLSSVTWYFKSDGDFTYDDTAEYVYSGSSIGGTALGSFVFDASQTGVYSVKVKVVDFCGEEAEAIYNYVVVYDPNGGFVTGGGWINSPDGALVNSNVSGKANFGLVAKYKRGKNNVLKLDGNTNFQFKEGDLHFKSNVYDEMSLVISGKKKATYRGSGTVNSVGPHKFLVTVIDGDAAGGDGSDKFRIKIWAKDSSSEIIYDNEFNASENADSYTILGGGSIVIHDPNSKNSNAGKITATADIADGLELKTWPNPSDSFFNLNIKSDNLEDNIEIRVFDMANKLVYKDNVRPNEVYTIGERLEFGIYIVQVTQSGRSEIIRIISR